MCRTFATNGTCPYGTRCRFIHQSSTLAQLRTATTTPRASASAPDLFSPSPRLPPSPGGLLGVSAFSAPNSLFPNDVDGSNDNLASLGLHLGGLSLGGNGPLGGDAAASNGSTPAAPAGSFLSMAPPGIGISNGLHQVEPQPQSPIAPPPGLSLSLSLAAALGSAPTTPRSSEGGAVDDPAGAVRRIASDTALAPSGTPTSARRLPVFSSLAEAAEK